jgi:hypothetical protein
LLASAVLLAALVARALLVVVVGSGVGAGSVVKQ